MAQLPPKVPGIVSDRTPPSWGDDFLEFSASKRRSHRRSVSDSVAFVEEHDGGSHEFHRMDDEQLFSVFNDDSAGSMQLSPEKQCTPSDNYSINEKAIEQQEEAESDCKADGLVATPDSETISDPKRVKRILANRQSAQRSRVRKLHYISELERSVTLLQAEVSTLSPRVAFLDHQRSLLTLGNSQLKQRIAALAQDNIFKDAHQEALKKEVQRLRKIYHEQSLLTNMEPQSSEDPSFHFEKDLFNCEDAAALRSIS